MRIIETSDNSKTLYSKKYSEHYHSINGAVTESKHIFIDLGLKSFSRCRINILEIGYGTGLNAILSFQENKKLENEIFYHGIDNYIIDNESFLSLDYKEILGENKLFCSRFYQNWNVNEIIDNNFTLHKQNIDFNKFNPELNYDLIYFDAFSPESQPEMWAIENLSKIIYNLNDGGILVSYCSKGVFKNILRECGMQVKRFKGPLGKRHVVKATKI